MFRFLHRRSLEWIHFGHQVVEAAAKGPCLCLLGEIAFASVLIVVDSLISRVNIALHDNLGSRIVNMAGVVSTLEQLLEVVGEANQIELTQPAVVMDSSWMYITMNDAKAV